ncbi:hypothetical protein FOZ62_007852, partial [Perkinsus olseni]
MDGYFGSVPLNEGEPTEGRSWGLYQSSLSAEAFNITVTDLRPYALTFRYARVTVAPIKVPTTVTAAVRITAPQGFLWRNIDSSGFAIHPVNHSSGRVLLEYNITSPWPGGVPSVAYGNQLLFPSAVYGDTHTYGFEADVEVPERNPMAGFNEWRIEVGWNGTTSESRPFVGVFSSPPVRSLSDAHVGYTYNAVGKENVLTFRIRLESHLFGPGGIVVEMPLGFSSVPYCTPLGVNNGPTPFPTDVHCAYMPLISPFPAISIIGSRTNGIPPGLYEWRLVTSNPDEKAELVTDDSTECGWNLCFTFYALRDVLDFTTEADYRLSTKGFPITAKMVEARVPFLSDRERLDTGRDDRPGRMNNIIFAFRLSSDTIVPGGDGSPIIFTLRGPEGFLFAEDCLGTVKVAEAEVFGGSARWPP